MTEDNKGKVDQRLLDLYDKYAHGDIDRREFVRRAGTLAVGGMSAVALAESVMPRYAEAQTVSFNDSRIHAQHVTYPSYAAPQGSGEMGGYLVRPKKADRPLPSVLVIHENRGLNPYIKDVARRAAVEGFLALAPDGLHPLGGYPGNDDYGRSLQDQLDPEKLDHDMIASAYYLKRHPESSGMLGATGFCWGGGMVNRLAVAMGDDLNAGAPFYGAPPDLDQVGRIRAPLLLHFAGLDKRINAMWPDYEKALNANNIDYTAHMYEGVNHGFHNNSTPRFDEEAAEQAEQRTWQFFREHLT